MYCRTFVAGRREGAGDDVQNPPWQLNRLGDDPQFKRRQRRQFRRLQDDGTVWGRPVDLLVLPDGSLLVSDDLVGAIYRISYEGE